MITAAARRRRHLRRHLLLFSTADTASIDVSDFDGGTIKLYSLASSSDAGDLLASGTLPDKPFANESGGDRALHGSWSMVATKNGTARGLLISNAGATINTWKTVTESGGGGDVIIDHSDVQINDVIAIATMDWDIGGGGAGVFANEPAGYTIIQDSDMAQVMVWPATYQGWVDDIRNASAVQSVVTDATAPQPVGFTDNAYIHGKFATTVPFGTAPWGVYRPFADPSEAYPKLFIGLWVRHATGWENNPGGGKSGVKFLWPAGDQVTGTLTYCGFDNASSQSEMHFQFNQQGAVDRTLAANLDAAAADVWGRIGSWVKIEMLLQANTNNSTADGKLDVWMDGVHTHQYTDVNWQMQTSRKWMSLSWNPTFGGGGNSPAHDQFQDITHIHISGHA